ncbi:MAG TPA: 3-hydroxyacyl-CoA dehydrogenase, partial [Gemmobacter sp.]|nr:3-hydroxyacyl-CoA dehydrogenase [Gemmobacter sp.]
APGLTVMEGARDNGIKGIFAMVAAQAFPRWEGGPMFWADRRGVMILRRDLEQWAEEAPEIWGMAPVLADLAAKGARFSSLG